MVVNRTDRGRVQADVDADAGWSMAARMPTNGYKFFKQVQKTRSSTHIPTVFPQHSFAEPRVGPKYPRKSSENTPN